jgi:hypothetical protein
MRLHNPIRVLAIVAIATMANALTGGQAQAGCGDYITIRNSDSASQSGMAGHTDFKPATSPKPCRGPHCSAHPSPVSPPMVPPVTVTAHASDLALGSLLDFDSDSHRSRHIPQTSDCDPIHRPSLPFHPPRIAL